MRRLLKIIYDHLPCKRQVFSMLKYFWHPSHRIYRHLHFKGVFTISLGRNLVFKMNHYGYEIENELFWKGTNDGWERVSIGLWKRLCERATTIIDIGANTGVYALVAKTINPIANVYAFEPVERVYDKLIDNVQINKFQITCIKKAVSNYIGKGVIYDTGGEHVYSVTVNKNIHDPFVKVRKIEIEVETLQHFIENNGISNIDLMKIDVETHEPEVLEGLGKYLAMFHPTLLIEILTDEVGEKVNRLVSGLNYLFFNIDETKGIRKVDKIDHSDYYNYLLCNEGVAKELNLT